MKPLAWAVFVVALATTGCASTGRYTELPAARTVVDVKAGASDSAAHRAVPIVVKLVAAKPLPVDRIQIYSSASANQAMKRQGFTKNNAYALRCGKATPDSNGLPPSGCVVIGEDLLASFPDDALAGVIAHELGHLERGHSAMKNESTAISTVSLIGQVLSYVPGPVGLAGTAINLSTMGASAYLLTYSRDHEREADASAIARLDAAGYCAGPTLRATFENIAKLRRDSIDKAQAEQAAKDPMPSGGGGIFSSHPALEERWKSAGDACSGAGVLR